MMTADLLRARAPRWCVHSLPPSSVSVLATVGRLSGWSWTLTPPFGSSRNVCVHSLSVALSLSCSLSSRSYSLIKHCLLFRSRTRPGRPLITVSRCATDQQALAEQRGVGADGRGLAGPPPSPPRDMPPEEERRGQVLDVGELLRPPADGARGAGEDEAMQGEDALVAQQAEVVRELEGFQAAELLQQPRGGGSGSKEEGFVQCLRCAAVLQQHRVQTFALYDAALDALLFRRGGSGDDVAERYNELCARATTVFASISQAVRGIAEELENHGGRQAAPAARVLRQLQEQEREKLTLVAALHMDRIRQALANAAAAVELVNAANAEVERGEDASGKAEEVNANGEGASGAEEAKQQQQFEEARNEGVAETTMESAAAREGSNGVVQQQQQRTMTPLTASNSAFFESSITRVHGLIAALEARICETLEELQCEIVEAAEEAAVFEAPAPARAPAATGSTVETAGNT